MELPVVAEIIPLSRLKNDLDFFTYKIPAALQSEIQVGQLVSIPFRSKNIDGIVLRVSDSIPVTDFELKEISAIQDLKPFLEAWQIDLIKRISEYYLVSMATIASLLIPDVPKKARAVEVDPLLDSVNAFKGALKKVELAGLNNRLVKYRREETKASVIQTTVNALKDGEQILIIVPQLTDIPKILSYIPDVTTRTAVYIQDLPIHRHWDNWTRVRNGDAQIIIGTRSAVFAPFNNLAHIIIDQEDDELFKQEEPAPRYRVHTVAKFLTELQDATITYLSESPSIEQLHRVAQKELEFHEFDQDCTLPSISIIDTGKERHAGNYSVLGLELQSAVESTNGKTLLVLNKNGYATGFYCRECKTTTKSTDGTYDSLHCKQCDGTMISFVGMGLDGVAAEVRTLYPNKKISTLNAGSILDSSADIVISTLSSALSVSMGQFSTVAALSIDMQEMLGDVLISERVFLDHFKLIMRLDDRARFFIQTQSPDHPYMFALSSISLKHFYAHALKERKSFGLPPYGLLVKIMYRNDSAPSGEKELKSLNAILKSLPSHLSVYPFQPMRNFYRFKSYYWSTIVKLNGENLLPLLRPLRGLPIIIDVDPYSLF